MSIIDYTERLRLTQYTGNSIMPQFMRNYNSDMAKIDAYFENYEAGINQTLHQVTMLVSVDVAVLALGQTASFTISSEVVVAETIIVGQVPNTFLQTGGEHGTIRENP